MKTIKWNKVSEGLPEKSGQYLVAGEDGAHAVSYFVKGRNVWAISVFMWKQEDITVWAEFPLYKELSVEVEGIIELLTK